MRQKLISLLPAIMILSCILLCTACAKQDHTSDSPSSDETESLSATVQISENSDTTDILNAQDTNSKQNSQPIEALRLPSNVSVEFYTEEQNSKKENDIIIYTNKCVYPIVTIEGNKDISDKINADIQSRVDFFHSDDSLLELAEYDYENYYDPDEPQFNFYAYSDELLFTVTRCDSNVISFLVTSQYYAGGAHGMDIHIGLNYDTQTGELIDFADLSENTDAFRQNTLTFHQGLAATNTYQHLMFGDTTDDLEEVLYQDDRWYLSTSGLVFFSNPYELGPFSSGRIEFTVPYTDLREMGMKEKYDYNETKPIRLQTEEICSLDLNGDGQKEKIQFYIENPGSIGTDLHFIINGTDYASEHEELSEQFSDDNYLFCWTQCFLYDMDAEDDTIEIAFQMNYWDWDEDINTPYTFLYRYEKDASLIYLGKMEGIITDPTVVIGLPEVTRH